jgi:hypothetical protein
MRGAFSDQGGLFSYISAEARVPKDHPLRTIRELVRDVKLVSRNQPGCHCGDAAVPDRQIAGLAGVAGAVEQEAVSDQQIVGHRPVPPVSAQVWHAGRATLPDAALIGPHCAASKGVRPTAP